MYRSAVRSANFRHHAVEFDAGVLHAGRNTVSFVLRSRKNWRDGGTESVITTAPGRPEVPASSVMYACIQLESGPAAGDGSCERPPRPAVPNHAE